jgi:hypothetical protein
VSLAAGLLQVSMHVPPTVTFMLDMNAADDQAAVAKASQQLLHVHAPRGMLVDFDAITFLWGLCPIA